MAVQMNVMTILRSRGRKSNKVRKEPKQEQKPKK